MPASREYVSGRPETACDPAGRTLISGVNWLGDSIMSMPAVREFARRHPAARLAMLAKPGLLPLWRLFPGIESFIELCPWPSGVLKAAVALRGHGYGRAYVFTQSFRSALVPFLAGVPERIGMPGHSRDWMLTAVVEPALTVDRRHQQFEYFDLMGMGDAVDPDPPSLALPEDVVARCRSRIDGRFPGRGAHPLVGVFPGAAHGPSKRWPAAGFAGVARRLAGKEGCRILVFGSKTEKSACMEVAGGAGDGALDLSGETSLHELAAMTSLCDAVLANDSGGMHLAAAAGTKVVAIYGLTDPSRTGPLGVGHRIIAAEGVSRGRDLKPDSREAREAMLSIKVDTVHDAVAQLLA